jgi:glycosyltransferase involved in cell wall biosynthesis
VTERSQPRKIALVGLTHPFRGGISHYTTLLCRALRQGHEVRFYALSRQYPGLLFPGTSQFDESNDSFAIEHDACIDSINPWSWFRTARKIAKFAPDLIVFSWWNPFFAPAFGTIARLSRWFAGTPSCYLCHNALPHERSIVDRILLRYVFNSGKAFIAHSKQDRDDLRGFRPDARVHMNPHPTYDVFQGADTPGTDEARERLGLSGRRVLLFFGFIRAYKGLDVLLEAVAALPADEGYHLVIVGEFYDDRERYREALSRLESQGRLTLIDRYVPNEEVGVYFAAADLVMVPYLSATQSGVIQIAYGFLKPVVATTVGGIPEVVRDGDTGYLVPPGDAGALAAAVRRYFDTADRGPFEERIAEENRKYSWERMVERIDEICEEL